MNFREISNKGSKTLHDMNPIWWIDIGFIGWICVFKAETLEVRPNQALEGLQADTCQGKHSNLFYEEDKNMSWYHREYKRNEIYSMSKTWLDMIHKIW